MAYDNTNTGALFNDRDKQSDKHPDFKGTINVDGKDYWLSGWNKRSQKGNDFISLSVQLKERKDVSGTVPDKSPPRGQRAPQNQAPVDDSFDDSIPF